MWRMGKDYLNMKIPCHTLFLISAVYFYSIYEDFCDSIDSVRFPLKKLNFTALNRNF